MVSFISLSKFLLFINIASAFIIPVPTASNINKLPVKVNRYNNNNLIKMKLAFLLIFNNLHLIVRYYKR